MKMTLALKSTLYYIFDKATGTFMGFVAAMAATSIVSHFFTTKSIRNLWGLTAKKTVIDKDTFSGLEWIFSVLIGFIVFEVMIKVVKKRIDENVPKQKFFRWVGRNNFLKKIPAVNLQLNESRIDNFENGTLGDKIKKR